MEITFPASRSCLWDEKTIGETIQLHLTSSGWIKLKLNSNVIDMALQHSLRQSCESEAWLIGTSVVRKNNTILIEVNRFDPGKQKKFREDEPTKLSPTMILPGDIPIHCRVINKCGSVSNNEGILTHNWLTLQNAFSLLDQRLCSSSLFDYTLLMLFRVIMIRNDNHMITIKGGCVMPSSLFQLSLITKIPLLPISLSRNLMAPTVQSTIKVGYLTMDKCRKLVPLLQSDESVYTRPLVGVWISGVNDVDHPWVWSTCLHYVFTTSPIDRVYGAEGGNSFLVLFPGKENRLWQCCATNMEEWSWHIGEFTCQLTSLVNSIELMPCLRKSAGWTLLKTAISKWKENKERGGTKKDHNDSLPCSSPAPFPASVPSFVSHDSDLSCLSEINTSNYEGFTQSHEMVTSSHEVVTSSHEVVTPSHEVVTPLHEGKVFREQCTNTSFSEQTVGAKNEELEEMKMLKDQLILLWKKENSKEANIQTTPTNTVATNTGASLLESNWYNCDRSTLEEGVMPSHSSQTSYSTQHSVNSSNRTLTPPISPPIVPSSVLSESILQRNLTSPECSYHGSSISETAITDDRETVTYDEEENKQYCLDMQSLVDSILGKKGGEYHIGNPSIDHNDGVSLDEGVDQHYTDFNTTSFIDVPRIKFSNDVSLLSEVTMDSKSNMASIIAQRYSTTPTNVGSADQYSLATHDYLMRHGLARNDSCPTTNILNM